MVADTLEDEWFLADEVIPVVDDYYEEEVSTMRPRRYMVVFAFLAVALACLGATAM